MHPLGLLNYFAALFLILFGMYNMIIQYNLIRKIIGMVILQTGVILFYVSVAVKTGGNIPVVAKGTVDISIYANPLPHALMLTAIVVGVSTLGVALTLLVSIYQSHQSIEEDEIIANLRRDKDV